MKTYKYYYENLSMIPDEKKYFVVHKGKNIATLDEAFVVNYLRPGITFIIKGTPWYVIDIDDRDVIVEPSNDILGAIPGWEGELLPVSYEVAQKAAQMKREVVEDPEFVKKYNAENVYRKIHKFMKKQEKYFIPDERTLALEYSGRLLILHYPLGSKGNETLSKVLSSFLTSYVGESVRIKSTPYSIIVEFPGRADVKLVQSILENIVPENVEYILENHIRRTPLFKYRFLQVARRFGLIEKEADFQRINVSRLIDALIDSPIYKETWNEIKHRDLDIERVIAFLESEKDVVAVNKISPY
jgi:ATP-dependent Lhr-like helicase